MTIEAELPDGRVLEFPDGTPTAVVQEAVRKMMGVAPASPSGSQSQVRAVDNAATPYTPEPSAAQRVAGGLVRAVQAGPLMPVVLANEGMKVGNELLEKGAYNVGGAVTDYTGSPAAGYAANVATQAIPAIVGGKVTGMVSSPVLKAAGERVMQSAVKPAAADLVSGDAKRAITTLLDEGINVTPGGMAELRKRVGGLHQKVTEAIASSKGTVDIDDVANSIDRAFNKFRWNLANRKNNLEDIQQAKKVFIETVDEAMGHYSDKMPVQLAQKIKQATQKYLSDSFGELSTAGKEGLKDITHGLRKGIEKVEPSVAGDNSQMEKLLNALSVTERHALQALNKNPAGLSLLAENKAAATAFMADRSALFKSLLARMLYQGRERIPQAVGGAAVGLYEGISNNQP